MQLDLLEKRNDSVSLEQREEHCIMHFCLIQQSTLTMQIINNTDQIHGKTAVIRFAMNTSG